GFKGIVATRVVWDLYELDPKLGLVGGGGFDFRLGLTPIAYAFNALPPDAPRWGEEFKRQLSQNYNRSLISYGHTTSLPVATNSISLDPDLKDAWGVPAIRMTYQDHPQDLRLYKYFAERSKQLLEADGANRAWQIPVPSQA